ncbi:MAG: hypothetical protein AAF916_01245 [Planctomycetota bacterium]
MEYQELVGAGFLLIVVIFSVWWCVRTDRSALEALRIRIRQLAVAHGYNLFLESGGILELPFRSKQAFKRGLQNRVRHVYKNGPRWMFMHDQPGSSNSLSPRFIFVLEVPFDDEVYAFFHEKKIPGRTEGFESYWRVETSGGFVVTDEIKSALMLYSRMRVLWICDGLLFAIFEPPRSYSEASGFVDAFENVSAEAVRMLA